MDQLSGTSEKVLFLCAALGLAALAPAQTPATGEAYRAGDFKLVYQGAAADLSVAQEDYKVAHIAAGEWAGKQFDPELGDIGPKTYARVFELLLRLKANYLWPAMHECTQAFNLYPENKLLADDYAIVMGSSHAEPMLRNNVTEWDSKARGAWDYRTNREGVRRYWDERAAENGRFENVYEIGMRGIHDSAMPGSGTVPEKVQLMEQIFKDQREILASRVNPNPSQVPQLFCAYKEVLELYQANLHVPDDAILGWADDNHGYIRQLSTPAEQKRAGGSAIYYHVSYWGAPHDYLWLASTPPSLIWEEMSKAFDYQTRSLWVLNVGDIKPAELATEYFLSMAWDMSKFKTENQRQFLTSWATREFGAANAAAIADVMTEYYSLGYARKPEHMGWNNNDSPISRTEFTLVGYGDEARQRLDRYAALTRAAEAIYAKIPPARKDAYYELVLYPVRGADLMNQKMLYADRSILYAAEGRTSANDYANRVRAAFARIETETEYFNTGVAGGKWKYMMSSNPRNRAVFDLPATAAVTPVAGIAWGVAVEGGVRSDTLPVFDPFTRQKHFIDIFKTGTTPFNWSAAADSAWVRLSQSSGRVNDDVRFWAVWIGPRLRMAKMSLRQLPSTGRARSAPSSCASSIRPESPPPICRSSSRAEAWFPWKPSISRATRIGMAPVGGLSPISAAQAIPSRSSPPRLRASTIRRKVPAWNTTSMFSIRGRRASWLPRCPPSGFMRAGICAMPWPSTIPPLRW